MSTMVRGYTTCVAGVGADMINVATPGHHDTQPEFVPGQQWIEIRIGAQHVRVPWTTGPLPPIGAHVTITVEGAA